MDRKKYNKNCKIHKTPNVHLNKIVIIITAAVILAAIVIISALCLSVSPKKAVRGYVNASKKEFNAKSYINCLPDEIVDKLKTNYDCSSKKELIEAYDARYGNDETLKKFKIISLEEREIPDENKDLEIEAVKEMLNGYGIQMEISDVAYIKCVYTYENSAGHEITTESEFTTAKSKGKWYVLDRDMLLLLAFSEMYA